MDRKLVAGIALVAGFAMVGDSVAVTAAPIHAGGNVSIGDANIEFEWQQIDEASGARQEALGLLMHPSHPHQICGKSMPVPAGAVTERFTATDATGKQVWSDQKTLANQDEVDTTCRNIAITDPDAVPGTWKFTVAINGTPVVSKSIEVAASLATAHFYADPNRPYTRGRINFTGTIPAAQWRGHFLWQMNIGPSGKPLAVRNIELEGPAKRLPAAGLHAARLYWFPASPARKAVPYVVRERYELSPGT